MKDVIFVAIYVLIGIGFASELDDRKPDNPRYASTVAVMAWPFRLGQLLDIVIVRLVSENATQD